MAKQFAISTRSFDKFQEKEAFSGILPEGLSLNIILRVFIQLQEFFFFRFFFKFVENADGFSENMILNPFTVNTAIHLNIEIISSELLVICSSLWIGVKLTIFFKRGFRWREHCFPRLSLDSTNLILIIAAHFLLPEVWLLQMITAVIAMVSAITDMDLMVTNLGELVKSEVLGACIIVSWESERGSYILPLSSVFFALTQFLRWPRRLKDFLSEVRIVCGPAFPLSVFATWLKRSEPSGLSFWVLLVAVPCSSVAAIFFRPDNSEVLDLFHLPVPSQRNRKVCHAILMIFSLLCMTVHISLYQAFPCMNFQRVCIVVVMLCVCFFLFATDTARIIASAVFSGNRDRD